MKSFYKITPINGELTLFFKEVLQKLPSLIFLTAHPDIKNIYSKDPGTP